MSSQIGLDKIVEGRAECLGTLEVTTAHKPIGRAEVLQRLQNPVWPAGSGPTVFDVVKPGQSVCLVVSDHTRKSGSEHILPVLIEQFEARGCSPADFFIMIATGIHRAPNDAELQKILGPEIYSKFSERVFIHNADTDLVEVGRTKRGHPVRVNRRAMEADVLIPIGTATFHYHAGFGGGRKSLVPGLASRDTIAFNHSLTLDPAADRIHPCVETGRLDGNPVAEEMLEAARLCNPDIIICTVLTPGGELADVFSGEIDLAHRAACRIVGSASGIELKQKADFVVASTNARDWIQSHKALFNASLSIHDEGLIVLSAPCPEGLGNERFRYWLKQQSVEEIFTNLRKQPEVNGQTALSTKQRGARTILVTSLSKADSQDLGIRVAPDVATATEIAVRELTAKLNRKPRFYIMPDAGRIVPIICQ